MVAAPRPSQAPAPQGAEERLLIEAAQHDPAKFAALYELHFERLYAFIASRVRNRAAAEDLTSEVFHKALANLPTFEWRGSPFAAWLFRIAVNAIVDRFKREYRDPIEITDSPESKASPPPRNPAGALELEAVEQRATLFRLVDKLPTVQRRVIYERFVEQRTIAEIAALLKKTPGAIKQLQFRALQTLRAQMEGAHA
jgi:RNA polymerase sigma-70 factor (ECF subfamily)